MFGVWRAEPNLSTFLSQWCDVASVRTDVDGNEVARTSSRQVAPRSGTGACGGRWVGACEWVGRGSHTPCIPFPWRKDDVNQCLELGGRGGDEGCLCESSDL